MTELADILDVDALDAEIADGFVRRTAHPYLPYFILNYTEKCQFDRRWNDVTRKCRGLIVNDDSVIVSRPWEKFFNYEEHVGWSEVSLWPDRPVRVYDKLDGSLGIAYPYVGENGETKWALATRGSFTSDQAWRGSKMLRDYIDGGWEPRQGFTYLFEVIYPENRIVVNYGGEEKLVLLDVLETGTGLPAVDFSWDYPGPWVEELFGADTLAEALALPPRENAEGVVIVFTDNFQRVKVKQEDYLRLHRLVTGMSERRIWECLVEGQKIEEICEPLPDEFHEWVQRTAYDIVLNFERKKLEAEEEYLRITQKLSALKGTEGWSRKDFALEAVQETCSALLFKLLDNSDIEPEIWKQIRPVGHNPMKALTEDVA